MNPFLGRGKEWLEARLFEAQEDLANGSTSQSIDAGDFSASDIVQFTPIERITFLLEALSIEDPQTYPVEETRRVSRTRASFE